MNTTLRTFLICAFSLATFAFPLSNSVSALSTTPSASISASQTSLPIGGADSDTITWSSQNVNSCTVSYASQDGTNTGSFPTSPNESSSGVAGITKTITYTITCTVQSGSPVSSSVTITVATPSTPTPLNTPAAPVSPNLGVLSTLNSSTFTWPAAPGASSLDAEMAPFIATAGSGAASWLSGDTLGNFLYGSQTQTIVHGSGGIGQSESLSGRQEVPCSSVAALSGLGVILVAGQSNSANSAQADANGNFYTTNAPIYNLNIDDGKCYAAKEPLLGANGEGQAFALPLADKFINAGTFKAVLLVPVGIGGSYIEQWRPNANYLFPRIITAISDMRTMGVTPTFVLWHQGEANAGGYTSSDTPDGTHLTITPDIQHAGTLNWMRDFFEMVSSIRSQGVSAPIFPAEATICGANITSNVIEDAQKNVVDPVWGIYPGPNTDVLPYSLRRTDDHCHFSSDGNVAHAQAWYNTLTAYLASHSPVSQPVLSANGTVSLNVNGQTNAYIDPGATYTLYYSSSNVQGPNCTVSYAATSGSPVGNYPVLANTSGSGPSGLLGGYTLTCTDLNGHPITANAGAAIRPQPAVTPAPAPSGNPTPAATPVVSVSLTINGQQSVTLNKGAIFTVAWSSSNASSCTFTNTNGQTQPLTPNTSGSSTGAAPAGGATYGLACTDSNGQQVTKSATIITATPAPTCSFIFLETGTNQATVPSPTPLTLQYTMQNGTLLDIAGIGQTGANAGSVRVSPSVTSTYSGTVTGPGGTGSCSALLTVSGNVSSTSAGANRANLASALVALEAILIKLLAALK